MTTKLFSLLKKKNNGTNFANANVPKETSSSKKDLTLDQLASYSNNLKNDHSHDLAKTALTHAKFSQVLFNNKAKVDDQAEFSLQLSLEGDITNQLQSSRCWIFSLTNMLRLSLMKKYHLVEFQFSQNYLYFFDKLEKCNSFLEQVLEFKDEEADSRLMKELLKAPGDDGGHWLYGINLVKKYGLVPSTAFPETSHSNSTTSLCWLVNNLLREFAATLRNSKHLTLEELRTMKLQMLNEVYKVLANVLGEPPKVFDWKFHCTNNEFHEFENLTPLKFYEDNLKEEVESKVVFVNDPRNEYDQIIELDKVGNIYKKQLKMINASNEDLKKLIIRSLKNGVPVSFDADVGQFFVAGIMDRDVLNYSAAFNMDVKNNFTKGDRLTFRESMPTHGMLFTGVHLEEGKPVRWRVQNSWGVSARSNGYEVMSDDWFSEFVYQIVIEKNFFYGEFEKFNNILVGNKSITLERWDPLCDM